MSEAWSLRVDGESIARLILNVPDEKVNVLSASVLRELKQLLTDLAERKDVRLLRIESDKPGIFIAGADIREIQAIRSGKEAAPLAREGQAVLTQLADLAIPTLAIINGACLGGGLELALACDFRVVSDSKKTKLGLPEVKLGILPGFGGTQRLPRLIGFEAALNLILSGRTVDAKKAAKIGLADLYCPEAFLEESLEEFCHKVLTPGGAGTVRSKRPRDLRRRMIDGTPLSRGLVAMMAKRQLLKKTAGQYPAPLKALSVIRAGFGGSIADGLELECAAFCELVETDVATNLIRLYFLNEDVKKDSGVKSTVEPLVPDATAVLGAGIMGGGIAWLFSHHGHSVRMKDIRWDAIASGYESAIGMYKTLVKRRKLSEREMGLSMHRIGGTLEYTGFRNADLVVEAVVENMEIKKTVLAEAERHIGPDTLLASNTSALSVTEMARSLEHPERFAGMHFFNPVNRMPLVEIVPGEQTSDHTIASLVAFVKKLRKTPVVVSDCAGFLVNRILAPSMNEAAHLLLEGADMEQIDKIIKAFGMPMGPFTLSDEVGIDVGYKVMHTLEEAYGQRMSVAPVLTAMHEELKLTGRKGGSGFYMYVGKSSLPNDAVEKEVHALRKRFDVTRRQISEQEILDRVILIMVNEAIRCLEEGVVCDAGRLDLAMIMGTGFAPFRGGPLAYADTRGLEEIFKRLSELRESCGIRFEPAPLLAGCITGARRLQDVGADEQH